MTDDEATVIRLPFPPSVNNLYRNAGAAGRVPAKHYTEWRQEAGYLLNVQHPRKHGGKVAVHLDLTAEGGKRHDADNCFKAVLDLLVDHQIIEADDRRIVRQVSATWVDTGPTRVLVTIKATDL